MKSFREDTAQDTAVPFSSPPAVGSERCRGECNAQVFAESLAVSVRQAEVVSVTFMQLRVRDQQFQLGERATLPGHYFPSKKTAFMADMQH